MKRLIEWLIKRWLPGYHLARKRGPYKKKKKVDPVIDPNSGAFGDV
jgi:hypothetical protein